MNLQSREIRRAHVRAMAGARPRTGIAQFNIAIPSHAIAVADCMQSNCF